MASNNHVLDTEALEEVLLANAVAPDSDDDMEASPNSLPVLSNFEWDESGDKPKKKGTPMPTICEDLYEVTAGWPKRVDKVLFVPGGNHRPRFLETPPQLFAWLDANCFIDWGHASDMITPERLFAHLQESAEAFDGLETVPHWPSLPDTHYMHPTMPNTEGQYLDHFVGFFGPETDVDRDLIKWVQLVSIQPHAARAFAHFKG